MNVRVPTLSSEVLSTDTPMLGDPAEAYEAGLRLNRLAEQLQYLLAAVHAARSQLASNRGLTVERVDSGLLERVQLHAQAALAVSVASRSEFQAYGDQLEQIHAKARRTEEQVIEHLAIIRMCAAQVQAILVAMRSTMQLHWSAEVPIEMPLTDAADDTHFESIELRARYEAEWRAAALRWRGALDELQLLRRQWRSLLEERAEVERFFVGALQGTVESEQLFPAGTDAAPVLAVPRLSATRHTAAGFGGAVGPGQRRNHPLLARLYEGEALQQALTGKPPAADKVAKWWRGLNGQKRQQLIDEAPLVVGNLAGVPLDSRIAANAVSAKHFANAEGISAEETNYWNRVAAGRVRLVVSDPGNSRIVEMIGQPGPNTARVITFLPGTMSQMKHFYSGGTQQVSEYLVTRSNGTSVAFVYKDGSWASWLGPGANTNYDRLQELGGNVAEFRSDVIDREPSLQRASNVAIAHSAGMSVLSGAEIAGARFDTVISLGGAFALREWRPDSNTEYHHFQYDNDAINLIDGGRLSTPHEREDVFEQHVFDSDGLARIESHSRIAEGPETNKRVLDTMVIILEELRK